MNIWKGDQRYVIVGMYEREMHNDIYAHGITVALMVPLQRGYFAEIWFDLVWLFF